MNAEQILDQIKLLLPQVQGLKAGVLYGSYARKEATPASDIDIQLLVDESFSMKELKQNLRETFRTDIQLILEVDLRHKLVLYLTHHPKIEFAICRKHEELDRHFLGSAIQDIKGSILYEINPNDTALEEYLNQIDAKHQSSPIDGSYTSDLIDKFLYEFETASAFHRRSDGYRFYYFYNIAFHVAVQLNQLAAGNKDFNFLPRYILAGGLSKEEQDILYQMNGSLFLPDANRKKRGLLDFFYKAIHQQVDEVRLKSIQQFCEEIMDRDYFWNFRDASKFNPSLAKGVLYRTATLTLFQEEERFDAILDALQIKTIIDLRADREVFEMPYTETTKSKVRYVRTPWDPWDQPEWFQQKYHYGTNEEIAYRFFILGCKSQIKKAMETILETESGSVAIHCFAGKDRTGIFISLLHLLLGAPLEIIKWDYLASEYDMKLSRLELTLDHIQEAGGIEEYLKSCDLTENQIFALKSKLSHGNPQPA
jgi:protein tyrosine/serine phosphatase/predicted nucleotidyltransferase